jgi:hypothetical protein
MWRCRGRRHAGWAEMLSRLNRSSVSLGIFGVQ